MKNSKKKVGGKRVLLPLRRPKELTNEELNGAKKQRISSVSSAQASSSVVHSEENEDEWEKYEKNSREDDWKVGDNEEDEDSDSDSSDAGILLQAGENPSIEDCTFDFKDMKEIHALAIRTLLLQDIENPTHALRLADEIASQAIVGTIITAEDGDDPFAFATILPLSVCRALPSHSDMLSALQEDVEKMLSQKENGKNKSATTAAAVRTSSEEMEILRRVLSPSSEECAATGVLIYRTYTNLPFQLVGPLHKNLWEDYCWAKSEEAARDSAEESPSDKERRTFFCGLKNILLLCACVDQSSGQEQQDDGSKEMMMTKKMKEKEKKNRQEEEEETGQKKKKKAVSDDAVEITGSATAVMFDRFEDDIFMQHASAAVLFTQRGSNSSSSTSSSGSGGSKRKTALLLSLEGWQNSSKELLNLLPDTT